LSVSLKAYLPCPELEQEIIDFFRFFY